LIPSQGSDAGAKFRHAVESVVAYARSGWHGTAERYCLICDESVNWYPKKGQRAREFDEIVHDDDCPVPDLIALLAEASAADAPAPTPKAEGT
jgi:hypothetical protein